MEQVYRILQDLRPDIEVDVDTKLVDHGILDSFDIVALVGELNDAFQIRIGVEELLPENFNSVESIAAMIHRLRNGT